MSCLSGFACSALLALLCLLCFACFDWPALLCWGELKGVGARHIVNIMRASTSKVQKCIIWTEQYHTHKGVDKSISVNCSSHTLDRRGRRIKKYRRATNCNMCQQSRQQNTQTEECKPKQQTMSYSVVYALKLSLRA